MKTIIRHYIYHNKISAYIACLYAMTTIMLEFNIQIGPHC